LRVLFLTPYFRPYLGGIERAIEQLSLQLLQSKAVDEIGVLTTKYSFPRVPQPDWPDRDVTEDGIRIWRLDGFPRRAPPYFSVPLVWFPPSQVRRYIEEFDPDVVHFVGDGWFWGHFWSWFHYRGRAKFIFTPSFHTLPLSKQWLRPLNGFICRRMDRVVPLTSLEREAVRKTYWIPQSKLEIIGWGASETGVSSPSANDGAVTILCVGRLGRHKGQMWLLDAYQRAREKFNKPVRLVLVGRDEGDEEAIRRLVSSSGMESEVLITGEVSDQELAEWYAASDCFVLFSHYEAFGLVYAEAMLYNLPVLTHDVGANREVLAEGAVITPRFGRDEAVEALVRLVNDDDYRITLGREGRQYALEHLTWSAVAQKYLELYQAAT
jgi:glycosyltransferase involved in cell wall biosynthesis